MNILLTGATGLLGSQVMFELLQQLINNGLSGKLWVLARSSPRKNVSAEERIKNILTHPTRPDYLKKYSLEQLLAHLQVIEGDVCALNEQSIPKNLNNIVLIHAASSVNLGNNEKTHEEICSNNYQGTLYLLDALKAKLQKVVFISSAYASGHREGIISDDFLSQETFDLRNPYEEFKIRIEKELVDFCKQNKLEWQILRPSIICGRLIDSPKYVISRFLVFYLIGKFFYVARKRMLKAPTVRIQSPYNSGLNIIPVDYTAKAIVKAMHTSIQQLNIVHSENVLTGDLFKSGFDVLRYKNYTLMNEPPEKMNFIEKMYQNTVNAQLKPYLLTPDYSFDTTRLRELMVDIPEPNISDSFPELIKFAVDHKFGDLY